VWSRAITSCRCEWMTDLQMKDWRSAVRPDLALALG
jgi:hypothetical protein